MSQRDLDRMQAELMKHAKARRNPLMEMREQVGSGEDWNPVEELKKNAKGAMKVASEVPQNLKNFATDPKRYLQQLMAKETSEHLGQMISGGYGPGNVGGLMGTISPAQRAANLQAMQVKSAAPGDWFHGTSRDIKQFDPKQAGATFLTRDPKFAEDFAHNSNAWMGENIDQFLTPKQLEAGKVKAIELMKQSYGTQNKPHQKNITAEIMNNGKGGVHASGEAQDFLTQAYKDSLPSGPNIMKVHTAVKKPWDYENPTHVADLLDELNGNPKFTNLTADQLSKGSWGRIEGPDVQEAIKSLGHDAFYINENGTKNLGVYDPAHIKSATGNVGTYDTTNPVLNKKDGGSVKAANQNPFKHLLKTLHA